MSWRPIETAPKESRHLLLFGNGSAIERCCYVASWYGEQWRLVGGGECDLRPTHWMPLPAPPIEGDPATAAASQLATGEPKSQNTENTIAVPPSELKAKGEGREG